MNNPTATVRSLLLTILLAVTAFFAQAVTAQHLDKPDLIQTFAVGAVPYGIVFDGDSIWVTNEADSQAPSPMMALTSGYLTPEAPA